MTIHSKSLAHKSFLVVVLAVLSTTALGETSPSLNLYGSSGLIDMPSAETQPDGMFSVTASRFGPISRTTLNFQITDRLSGSFRYLGVGDWNRNATCLPTCTGSDAFTTYYDRSFDLRYQILREGRYLPSVTIGMQDFVGTGLIAGEYVVATKTVTPGVKVTAGLGWGRLGSYGAIGSPFGDRPAVDIGTGGNFNFGQWFRGPAAPFGGIEWQVGDAWTLKAEYSSDAYAIESARRGTFDRKSPVNFGIEYQQSERLRLGAYYMYGREVGLAANFFLNPKKRPTGSVRDGAPDPVKPRPSRTVDAEAYDPGWTAQEGAGPILIRNMNKRLENDGVEVSAVGYTGSVARVTVENGRYDATAQVIGRVARAMANTLPASVETFEIVPVVNGIPVSKVIVRRADLERLEFDANATEGMRTRVQVQEAGQLRRDQMIANPDRYPRFTWSLAPNLQTSLFDPNDPLRYNIGAKLSAAFEVAPGFVLSGAVVQPIFGNLDQSTRVSDSVLPKVRSDGNQYDKASGPTIESLTAAWFFRPAPQLYGRVTAGYLEQMFAGASAEVLWKRVDSPLALGAEVNYVRQRDFDQQFGLRDYSVVTGHVSGYYEFGDGFHAQLDVGRYLAGDVGATLSVRREFANGWQIGAFATKTDVSASDFGEGSFDKGITLKIPLTWGLGSPNTGSYAQTIRPVSRDGGARLNVGGRLYETVRGYDASGIDSQWGRFWK